MAPRLSGQYCELRTRSSGLQTRKQSLPPNPKPKLNPKPKPCMKSKRTLEYAERSIPLFSSIITQCYSFPLKRPPTLCSFLCMHNHEPFGDCDTSSFATERWLEESLHPYPQIFQTFLSFILGNLGKLLHYRLEKHCRTKHNTKVCQITLKLDLISSLRLRLFICISHAEFTRRFAITRSALTRNHINLISSRRLWLIHGISHRIPPQIC